MLPGMKAREIERFRLKLEAFLADVVIPMGRKDRGRHAEEYIRGLLMDGERKSIEPMANRLPGGDVQALQQFVNQSPWRSSEVRASLARKVEREFVPEAYWLIDEVSFPKRGKHSVGVARQYCGALGKTANCQVAVSLDLGTEESSTPLNWALYLPKDWIADPVRRKKAEIPNEITFKTKIDLALDLVDETRGWGLQGRLILADSAYGEAYDFRQGLRSRELDYVVQVRGDLTAWIQDPHPAEPLTKRGGKIPRRRLYAKELPPTRSLRQIAEGLPSQSWKQITWREGTKGPLSSRFARVVVWMANGLARGKTMEAPKEELLIEWPEGDKGPWKYWLSSLPPHRTSFRALVRKAKGRFRIEQDYEELKGEVGLDHFEGRSWRGWHHHVTLVTLAYAFLMLERMGNKKNFWIDLASCPPMDPEMLDAIHGHMSHLQKPNL
jgi:SRSO17 transposase